MKRIEDSRKYLSKAQTDIDTAVDSYKKNFKGNAASKKLPAYAETKSQIATQNTELSHIWTSASGGKAGIQSNINTNNSKMGKNTQSVEDCNKVIKECDTKIGDNRKIINDYKNRIRDLEKDISRLERKL